MNLVLNIYTDDTLREIKRVAEADQLKIPYRVAMYVAQSLDTLDLKNENDIFKFITGSLDKVDKIIKATFGVSDAELDCVNVSELSAVGVEIYKWAITKLNSLKEHIIELYKNYNIKDIPKYLNKLKECLSSENYKYIYTCLLSEFNTSEN